MKTKTLTINTGSRMTVVDLTDEVRRFVAGSGDGLVNISVPHATAGIAVMELGAGSEHDLIDRLDSLLPRDDRYVHSHGSKGHGADHLVPAFINPTVTLPVIGGSVSLGTWQRIALVDTNVDNPNREVLLCLIEG